MILRFFKKKVITDSVNTLENDQQNTEKVEYVMRKTFSRRLSRMEIPDITMIFYHVSSWNIFAIDFHLKAFPFTIQKV